MALKLTIGMATYDDFDGVYFTVQAMRMYHPEVMPYCEIVVVDNNPDITGSNGGSRPHSRELQKYIGMPYGTTIEAVARKGGNVLLGGFQYRPLQAPVGTSGPRDMVFQMARGEFVLCVDSHVLLAPGSLARLLDWAQGSKGSKDLICGPMMYDDLDTYSTHYNDVWRAEMWGTWGTAWGCPRCRHLMTTVESGNVVEFRDLLTQKAVTACESCSFSLPAAMAWSGHNQKLSGLGFFEAARDLNHPPFEVPGQGLGLFGCRKDAWLGFPPNLRGFGGEEMCLHEMYRQAGRKTMCLPFLRWNHRFHRPAGIPFPANVWNKVRNYVIWHAKLGLSLDPVRAMFLDTGKIPGREWAQLIANPVDPPEWPAGRKKPTREDVVVAAPQAPQSRGIDAWYDMLIRTSHDFRGHESQVKKLASEANHITELGGRRGSSSVCLLAGGPRTYRLIDPNRGAEWEELSRLATDTEMVHTPSRSEDADPDPTDLLLIDTRHHGEQLTIELDRYSPHVRGRIIIHDTVLHGQQGEEGKEGLLMVMKDWLDANPAWFVAIHDAKAYGLTVLSKLASDKPPTPIEPWLSIREPRAAHASGPGTQLKAILASFGIMPSPYCDCNRRAAMMDQMGAAGCKAHRDEIVGWLKEGWEKWQWRAPIEDAAAKATAPKTRIGVLARVKGMFRAAKEAASLSYRINPLDPIGSLVDEAIRRAEKEVTP